MGQAHGGRGDHGLSARRPGREPDHSCMPDTPPALSRVQVHSSRPGGYCLTPVPGLARPPAAGKRRLHHTERTAWGLPRTCPPCVRLARLARGASLVLGEQGKGLHPRDGGQAETGGV